MGALGVLHERLHEDFSWCSRSAGRAGHGSEGMRDDKMSMPGFTAETALFATTRSYRAISKTAGLRPAVSPSLLAPRGSKPGCIPDCICTTPEGCPCCDVVTRPGPIALREESITMTCTASHAASCQATCDKLGGGMSSNPDGTVACTIYAW
jgi:hypothetical protein